MKLIWATDLHFNFLPDGGAGFIGEEFSKRGDAILMTGDLSESKPLELHLSQFVDGFKKPVYYVLGNHDAYGGAVRKGPSVKGAVWLTMQKEPIQLTNDVGLVGDDGWYDGGAGNPYTSNVMMSDFSIIDDFMGLGKDEIIDKVSKLGVLSAKTLEPKLRSAAKSFKTVIVGTHVPPYIGATWHNGKVSNSDWLPWFCNVEMGKMISQVAKDCHNVKFDVRCGHTHSYGVYRPLKNVSVVTGSAQYGDPQIVEVMNVV